MSNYYESELNRVNDISDSTAVIQVSNDGKQTRYMNLNLESIAQLRLYLNKIERDLIAQQ